MSAGLNEETFDGTYKDQLARRVIGEEARDRRRLVRLFREEFADYHNRMRGVDSDATVWFHQSADDGRVSRTIVNRSSSAARYHGAYDELTHETMWLIDNPQDPEDSVLRIRRIGAAVGVHDLRFRVSVRDTVEHIGIMSADHAQDSITEARFPTERPMPPGPRSWRKKNTITGEQLDWMAGAPGYVDVMSNIGKIGVHKALYEPIGIVHSLGPDTVAAEAVRMTYDAAVDHVLADSYR